MTIHGDLYYEGKEFETRLKEKKPGDLSEELRTALGMPIGPNCHKIPPPWLIAQQRFVFLFNKYFLWKKINRKILNPILDTVHHQVIQISKYLVLMHPFQKVVHLDIMQVVGVNLQLMKKENHYTEMCLVQVHWMLM